MTSSKDSCAVLYILVQLTILSPVFSSCLIFVMVNLRQTMVTTEQKYGKQSQSHTYNKVWCNEMCLSYAGQDAKKVCNTHMPSVTKGFMPQFSRL
jgi:hypothetical protein